MHQCSDLDQKLLDKTGEIGLLSLDDLVTLCGHCSTPMIAASQDSSSQGSVKEHPLFCSGCDRWFHERCAKKSVWSGQCCPSCKKPLIRPDSCPRVHGGATLVAVESVGAIEVTILLLLGALSLIALIIAYALNWPIFIKVIAWGLAVPLALPWLGIGALMACIGIIATVSDLAPGSAFRTPSEPVEAPSLRLRIVESHRFRQQPLLIRLGATFFFYLKHGAISTAIVAFIVFMIYGLIIFTHPKPE